MVDAFRHEKDFEDALVEVLTHDKGWCGGGDSLPAVLISPDEDELIDNWARVLFENNNIPDRLNGCPLTKGEKAQLMEQVRACKTPAEANRFINGGSLSITRDNPDDAVHLGCVVSLKIYDRHEIAGGSSVYQIARQPRFPASGSIYPKRRGDVMLLVNGLPVIHVELKRSGVPISNAVTQITKYLKEGVFSGLFSLVQVFVAVNPEESCYFANPGANTVRERKYVSDNLLFRWADANNERQDSWREISEHLLSIPMAHKLVGFYTVADSGDGQLKVMRSYQIHAVEAIDRLVSSVSHSWGSSKLKGGYVWHTTGSGKTLTSFKAAQLIATSKKADKVVFLVDRIQLGSQSLENYQNFANPDEEVSGTKNSAHLKRLLLSNALDTSLIVTSIQKLGIICKQDDGALATLRDTRLVIIVDECHRSVFGENMRAIQEALPYALIIGFTGTPIFEENSKLEDLTTPKLLGDELARYTITDGLDDGSVLGFDVTRCPVFPDDSLREQVALEKAHATDVDDALSNPKKKETYLYWMQEAPMAGCWDDETDEWTPGVEDCLRPSLYNHAYRVAVVDDIATRWRVSSSGGVFHALLATSSIADGIDYYRIFKKNHPELKVTGLFDPSDDNTQESIFKLEGLKEIIEDYNERYHTPWELSSDGYRSYRDDVATRLAHKGSFLFIDKNPDEQLDLVIVVNQLLTGFDSRWLNALYLDKCLEYEHIIQAFSRTNRTFGPEKPFGAIRYYRQPYTMQNNIDRAVSVYSGDRVRGLFIDDIQENIRTANAHFTEIEAIFKNDRADDFSRLPRQAKDKAAFSSYFRALNSVVETILLQGFSWEDKDSYNPALAFSEDIYLVLVQRYHELKRDGSGGDSDDIPYDIDPHIMNIDTTRINADYMNRNFEKWLDLAIVDADSEETMQALDELHRNFSRLSIEDQEIANSIIYDLQHGRIEPQDGWMFNDYINDARNRENEIRIHAIADALGVEEGDLKELINLHPSEDTIDVHGRFSALWSKVDREKFKEKMETVLGCDVTRGEARRTADLILRRAVVEGPFDINEGIREAIKS